MHRVVIVGGPGSGKSALAAAVATKLTGGVAIELDALWWGRDWSPAGRHLLRDRLLPLLSAETWVVEGNYFDEVADLVWPLADTIVWLDLPRNVAMRRVVLRSARRVLSRSPLWNGNRESLAVLAPRSIWRLVRRWPGYNARIECVLNELGIESARIVRLRSADEVRVWLERA